MMELDPVFHVVRGVLDVRAKILEFALGLVNHPLTFHLIVTGEVPNTLFDVPFGLIHAAFEAIAGAAPVGHADAPFITRHGVAASKSNPMHPACQPTFWHDLSAERRSQCRFLSLCLSRCPDVGAGGGDGSVSVLPAPQRGVAGDARSRDCPLPLRMYSA